MGLGPSSSFNNSAKSNPLFNVNSDNNTKSSKLDINLSDLESIEINETDFKEISFDFFTKHATINESSNNIIEPPEIIEISHQKTNNTNNLFKNTITNNNKDKRINKNNFTNLLKIDPNFNALPLGQGKLYVNIANSTEKKSLQDKTSDYEFDDFDSQILLMDISIYAERKAKGEIESPKGEKLRLINVEILEDGSHNVKASSKKDKIVLEKIRERGGTLTIENVDGSKSSIDLQNANISKMNINEYQRYYQIFSLMLGDLIQRLAEDKKKAAQQKDDQEPPLLNRAAKINDAITVKGKENDKIDIISRLTIKILQKYFHELSVDKEKNKKIREEKEEEFREEMKENYKLADEKKDELKVQASKENIEIINTKKITLIKGKHI